MHQAEPNRCKYLLVCEVNVHVKNVKADKMVFLSSTYSRCNICLCDVNVLCCAVLCEVVFLSNPRHTLPGKKRNTKTTFIHKAERASVALIYLMRKHTHNTTFIHEAERASVALIYLTRKHTQHSRSLNLTQFSCHK